jgi:DNA replication protein DnaC
MNAIFRTNRCECGEVYEYEAFEFAGKERSFDRGLCDPCDAAYVAKNRKEHEDNAKATISRGLLEAFGRNLFDTDLTRLSPKMQEIAKSYTFGEKGVGFVGVTNLGKTRCLFSIVKRIAMEEGKSYAFLTGPQLAQALKDTRSDDARERHDARQTLDDAREATLLVLDDIAQEKASGEVLTAFWDLLDTRRSKKLPLFWTSNVPAAQFRGRFEEAKADSVITRLKDISTIYPL